MQIYEIYYGGLFYEAWENAPCVKARVRELQSNGSGLLVNYTTRMATQMEMDNLKEFG